MRGEPQPRRERDEAAPRRELTGLHEGEVLCDRHRRECYQVSGIDDAGVALQQDGTEFYIPRSLFVTWYPRRLFPIENTSSIDTPEWCSQHRDHETRAAPELEADQVELLGRTAG